MRKGNAIRHAAGRRVGAQLAIALVSIVIWGVWWWVPVTEEQRRLTAERSRLQSELLVVEAEAEFMEKAGRFLLDQKRAEVVLLKQRLSEKAETLVPPREMVEFLETMLDPWRDLSLVSVEGLGAAPVFSAANRRADKTDGANRYYAQRHRVRLVIRGGVDDVHGYLQSLRTIPRTFFWEGVEFEVGERQTTAAITLSSLSLNAEVFVAPDLVLY